MVKLLKEDLIGDKNIYLMLKGVAGLGTYRAKRVCDMFGLSSKEYFIEDDNELLEEICNYINNNYIVKEDIDILRNNNIRKKGDLKTYCGIRHTLGMPVRGQKTHNNAKIAKRRNILLLSKDIWYSRLSSKERRFLKRKDKRAIKQDRKKLKK